MRGLSVGFGVLQAVVLTVVLTCPDWSVAEPLSLENLQKPATQEQIPEMVSAMQKLNKGEVEAALADMKAAVKAHPQLPPAEVIMAEIFGRSNQGAAMQYWLERAVLETPNDPQAYAMLGQMAVQGKQMVQARLLFEKAYDLLKSFNGDAKRKEGIQVVSCQRLAGLAMNRKEWDLAKGYLDESLKLKADDAGALQMLGRVLFEQGKMDEALAKLNAARKTDSQVLTPEALLAQWCQQTSATPTKADAKAGQYMIAALNREGRDYKTRLVAADWAFQTQQFEQARKQIDYALQLAEKEQVDPTPALNLAGNIAIFQGDFAGAEGYLRKALDRSPSNAMAMNNLALALCEQDDDAKKKVALEYARINGTLNPNDIEAYSTLGRVLFRQGNLTEADNVFRKVLTAGRPLSPDTVYYIASLYAQTDRKEDAKKWLGEAVKKEGLFSQRKNAEQLLKELGGA